MNYKLQLARMVLDLFHKTKFIALHFAFWVGVWFFFVYFFSYNSSNLDFVIWFSSFLLPVTMLTTYFVVYHLIPKYLFEKRYWMFMLYGVYTLIFSLYLVVLTMLGCFIFLTNMNIGEMPPMSRNYLFTFVLVYIVVGFVSFVKLLNHNFKMDSKNKELENKILASQLELKNQELSYLKKQIHPHFLFNTLNTIYGFALKQSKETPGIILKLSNLLDYILYQVNKPKVLLLDEIAHLKEYVALEKIRFQDTLGIEFETDDFSDYDTVPPLLFIPFVENAFKHGSIIDGSLKIQIAIKKEQQDLRLLVSNSYRMDKDDNRVGIGLENSKKQLDLLFDNRYDLNVAIENNQYKVDLKILNILN